ncbi:glutathione-dependent formaldehyde-activating protein [Hyphomonas polymorpha PS728]|uniref:Glutathione-dependent formaldehyde-activating protein n=2 Tax=Hyphomonas TaxID=85 RepID=A0A062VF45_9PROT|nr:GFA family protein [Hyphomonas polymorpha]KCZ98094.1 glutathione-dependent formaldehyde-activating protein [Hyphomonas polymorpha PS728]
MKRMDVLRPPLPSLPLEGGCHCGRARYRVRARPMAVNACHCGDCQRLAGAPFGVYLHVAKAGFEVTSGQLDLFRRTGGSGNQISIYRCRHCGTRLWHGPDVAPDLIILCAGTLDAAGWAIPTSHIFVEEAWPDAVAATDALVVEAFTTTRAALWDHFTAIYGPG